LFSITTTPVLSKSSNAPLNSIYPQRQWITLCVTGAEQNIRLRNQGFISDGEKMNTAKPHLGGNAAERQRPPSIQTMYAASRRLS